MSVPCMHLFIGHYFRSAGYQTEPADGFTPTERTLCLHRIFHSASLRLVYPAGWTRHARTEASRWPVQVNGTCFAAYSNPLWQANVFLRTLARGARQLVVQDALEMMWSLAGSYFSWLTPITNMGASLEGAVMMTFLAPPVICWEACGSGSTGQDACYKASEYLRNKARSQKLGKHGGATS